MITFHVKGNFKRLEKFLVNSPKIPFLWRPILQKYAEQGLAELKRLTPKDSGITAESWTYTISRTSITYENNTRTDSQYLPPLVILLQYGHATRNGGYVQAIDFINPALRPIFDNIAIECWKEVEKL